MRTEVKVLSFAEPAEALLKEWRKKQNKRLHARSADCGQLRRQFGQVGDAQSA
jgi:hypothetical protein